MVNEWNDISINQFAQIKDAMEIEDEVEKNLTLLAIIEKTNLNTIMEMPMNEVREKMNQLQFLYKKPRTRLMKGKYKINGKTYRVFLKPDEMTTAQYIDFQSLADNCIDHLPEFLAVFLIPENHKYNQGYDLDEVRDDIGNHFGVEDGLAMSAFFLTMCEISMHNLLKSSLKEIRKALKDKNLTEKERETLMEIKKNLKGVTYTSGWDLLKQ